METIETNGGNDFASIPQNSRLATKFIVDILFTNVYPLILRIRNKLYNYDGCFMEDDIKKVQDVFILCCSQIKKCYLVLLQVFKVEVDKNVYLQEARQCSLDRLAWCISRLQLVEENVDKSIDLSERDTDTDNSILVTPMYFVNWIDHTFEVLARLADVIYKNKFNNDDTLCFEWKNCVVECVRELHVALDELLLSAMTLCKYCLSSDQLIVKARCQVVLREAKSLLNELIEGDLARSSITVSSLKLPIMPSNINVLIDVLKDVLYVLETNTNTALLALVVDCFSNNSSPVEVLKNHFRTNNKGACKCHENSMEDLTEDCSFVKDFDLYNERLLHIGSFAVSCSSDQSRILAVRSGLASLEALDPHLVPAVMVSPDNIHTSILTNSWKQEVEEIRDSVFLIVDPTAFAEKCKQILHENLLRLMKVNAYTNALVCDVINVGVVLHEFFAVYDRREPEALLHHDKLVPLLADLDKVLLECQIVSNILSSPEDFTYNVMETKSTKEVTFEQLLKRLKLLYTLVTRISTLLAPKEKDHLFSGEEDEVQMKNITHTVNVNGNTYVNSPKKNTIASRSIFARTTNLRSSTAKFSLCKTTKNLVSRRNSELNFSVQLDELFNLSDSCSNRTEPMFNKHLGNVRERSILYNVSPRQNRSSLRKALLSKQCNLPFEMKLQESATTSNKESFMDETTNLQVTEILDQMHDMSNAFLTKTANMTCTFITAEGDRHIKKTAENVLKINVNNANSTITRRVWNIPVNSSIVETPFEDSCGTLPSNVNTLERLSDLDLLESRLSSLKMVQNETSL